jgi:hypothetical protein
MDPGAESNIVPDGVHAHFRATGFQTHCVANAKFDSGHVAGPWITVAKSG